MSKKLPEPEFIDIIAAQMNVEILDRAALQAAVNEILVSMVAPRLYSYELEGRGIISPKKASDARAAREVAQ